MTFRRWKSDFRTGLGGNPEVSQLFHSVRPLLLSEIGPSVHLAQLSSCRIGGVRIGPVVFAQETPGCVPLRLQFGSSVRPALCYSCEFRRRSTGGASFSGSVIRGCVRFVTVELRAGLDVPACQTVALLFHLRTATSPPSTSEVHCCFGIGLRA